MAISADGQLLSKVDVASVELINQFYPRQLTFSDREWKQGKRIASEESYKVHEDVDGYLPNFPVIIKGDGYPWTIGNLYLTRLALDSRSNDYHHSSHKSKALHLCDYLRFLEKEDLDFAVFPESQRRRPTYRYRNDLLDRVSSGLLSRSTASARINVVVKFYRTLVAWGLLDRQLLTSEIAFKDFDRTINYINSSGFSASLSIQTTDISIKGARPTDDPYVIIDQGRLRPLIPEEQYILLNALRDHNRCLQLIFMVALATGARLQTVCTLSIRNILNVPINEEGYALINYGGLFDADGKGGDVGTLWVPERIIRELKHYIYSDVAKKRRILSFYGESDSNYLFLTRNSTPYYTSKREMRDRRNKSADRRVNSSGALEEGSPKIGDSVGVFIRQELLPSICKKHTGFHKFSFHDLRATFGMNLLEACYKQIDSINHYRKELGRPLIGYSAALDIVQVRLNHKSRKTTERYLKYRDRIHWRKELVAEFERRLIGDNGEIDPLSLEISSKAIIGNEGA
ncbi:hypothetical protein M8009_17490 [Halomonas sp. ATCH28]|uniref:Tyr recombinase domain-containing protein n=1 Tax=Halomonas gemina TaxID=2945105 RepID=A0ABT0T6S2_9GAMM|nr:hypothetical protein [Halomonas gemina]MCL7942080.1 hypothetical protein [Halomonas gemina]